MTHNKTLFPYPNVGEIFNQAAELFCSKPTYSEDSAHPDFRLARKLKDLAAKGDYDRDLIDTLKNVSASASTLGA